MSTPALAAGRALAVLNYLTANPQRSFTLSELSTALQINKASLSSVLRAHTDAGYLTRHPRHKTYSLGLATIAAGHAAAAQNPVVELARPEMRRLAKETDCECVGSAVIGAEILILTLEGKPALRLQQMMPGQRLPLRPPMGEVFVAWGSKSERERWLRAAGESDATRDHLLLALHEVRRRGYSVNLFTDRLFHVSRVLTELASAPLRADLQAQLEGTLAGLGSGYELLDTAPDETYEGALIVAPVFGADGSVVFAITISGLMRLTGRDIVRAADRLGAVTLHLTRQIGGRVPELRGGDR
jgi:DNA-binding IclR family transcriptional regulator